MDRFKVFYNSKLAKALTFMRGFSTIMFFGFVFTEKSKLSERELKHESAHVFQYRDCFSAGMILAIILLFTWVALNDGFGTWWMLTLLLIPLLLFYVIYGINLLWNITVKRMSVRDAYENVCFEKHAYWIDSTWDKPCEEQNHYVSFGWLNR